MRLSPDLRKLSLTAHVTASVGWLGSVAAFLSLAVAGLTSQESQVARAAYLAMQTVTWAVIVPLSVASLITGVIQSLGTTWGLLRHYWILVKLLLTVVATAVLLLHTQPIDALARAAAAATLPDGDDLALRVRLIADAGAALLVLLAACALSIYKPRGVTRYGWQKQREAVLGAR